MKAKSLFILLILALLSACAPAKVEAPTATAMPTATMPPSPTAEPTATLHPVPENLLKLQQQNYHVSWDDKEAEWIVASSDNVVIGIATSNGDNWRITVDSDFTEVTDMVPQVDDHNKIIGFVAEVGDKVYYLDLKANEVKWGQLKNGEIADGELIKIWNSKLNQFEKIFADWRQLSQVDVSNPIISSLLNGEEEKWVFPGVGNGPTLMSESFLYIGSEPLAQLGVDEAHIEGLIVDSWTRSVVFNNELSMISFKKFKVLVAVGVGGDGSGIPIRMATPLAIEKDGVFSVLFMAYDLVPLKTFGSISNIEEYKSYWKGMSSDDGFVRAKLTTPFIVQVVDNRPSRDGYMAWIDEVYKRNVDSGYFDGTKSFKRQVVLDFVKALIDGGHYDETSNNTLTLGQKFESVPTGLLSEPEIYRKASE